MIAEVEQLSEKPAKLRQFAAAWLVFFLALGFHQWIAGGHKTVGITLITVAVVAGIPGLLKPGTIRWLFVGAMTLAFPIGWLVSHLALGLMFYGVLTPVALAFKVLRRDALWRRPASNRSTLWVPKSTPQDVRSYFRQY